MVRSGKSRVLGANVKRWVWRKQKNSHTEKHLIASLKYGRGCLMLWAVILSKAPNILLGRIVSSTPSTPSDMKINTSQPLQESLQTNFNLSAQKQVCPSSMDLLDACLQSGIRLFGLFESLPSHPVFFYGLGTHFHCPEFDTHKCAEHQNKATQADSRVSANKDIALHLEWVISDD